MFIFFTIINKSACCAIFTNQLNTMIDWYKNVLDMHSGYRPPSNNSGAWIYSGDVAMLHLVEIDNNDAVGSEEELKLEHFAFAATGLKQFEEKLRKLDIPFRRSDKPDIKQTLMNVWDPDGNHIHIDFKTEE